MDHLTRPVTSTDRWAPPQRRLGVVDGLGPRTTARFYSMLCDRYRALTGGAYPDVLVQSISVQRHLVEAFSAGSFRPGHQEALRHLVTRTCRSLACGGADVIAIACNAVTVDPATVSATRVGMVEATRQRLQHVNARRAGLLAPSTMVSAAAYELGLGEAGIAVVPPAPRDQEIVDRFIEALQWSPTPVPIPREFLRVVSELGHGVDALVLDSADLGGVVDAEMAGKPVVDSMSALVDASCRALLEPIPRTAATPFDTSPQPTLRAPVPEPEPDTGAMPACPWAPTARLRGLGALTAGFIGAMCFGAAAGGLTVHYTNPHPAQANSSAQAFDARSISQIGG